MTRDPFSRPSRPGVRPAGRIGGPDLRLPLIAGGVAVLLVGALWVLFLPPFSIARQSGWSGAGDGSLVRKRDSAPKPPDGFQLASPYYEIRSPQDKGFGPASLTIPLGDRAGRGLSLFTWTGSQWKRLGPAEVTADGKSARGQTDLLPDNIAVMRRTAGGFQVQGLLAPGANLHPEAEKLVTTRSPGGMLPRRDGTIDGQVQAGSGDGAVAVIPVVRATGGEDAESVNAILADDVRRQQHAQTLANAAQQGKLDGLDIEYSAIAPNLGGQFTDFVATLATALHRTGQTLTVTLPLPRRESTSWNTAGYDWKALAGSADYLRIQPERDQSVYRRNVRDGLNYLTGLVDAKKIILTLTPMAAEKSDAGIRPLTALEALSVAAQFTVRDRDRLTAGTDIQISADNLAREGGTAGLIWDSNAAAVSFVTQGEQPRTFWIENQYSAAFKLEFVQLWGLGGVAVEEAQDVPGMSNVWPAVATYQGASAPTLLQPNPGLLRPQWLVDGRSAEVARSVFTWKAPGDAGEHTIGLVVSDGVMRAVGSQKVTLQAAPPAGAGTATPTTGSTPNRVPTLAPTSTPARATTTATATR